MEVEAEPEPEAACEAEPEPETGLKTAGEPREGSYARHSRPDTSEGYAAKNVLRTVSEDRPESGASASQTVDQWTADEETEATGAAASPEGEEQPLSRDLLDVAKVRSEVTPPRPARPYSLCMYVPLACSSPPVPLNARPPEPFVSTVRPGAAAHGGSSTPGSVPDYSPRSRPPGSDAVCPSPSSFSSARTLTHSRTLRVSRRAWCRSRS